MDVTTEDITISQEQDEAKTTDQSNITTNDIDNGNNEITSNVDIEENQTELQNVENSDTNTNIDFAQPSTSVSLQNENTDETVNTSVDFPKLKTNVKNRHFRRKNTWEDELTTDDSLSGTSDGAEATYIFVDTTRKKDNENGENEPRAETAPDRGEGDNSSVGNDRLSSDNSDDNSPDLFPDSDESNTHNIDSQPIPYDKICNPKLSPNWYALPEILKRQTGYSAKLNGHLQFQHRYYGSLHVAQRFELASMMEYHDGCVNALGFNPTGNLIASASDDLRVVIWDWAIGKRKTSWVTKHRSNVFQSKFLALSCESELQLVTSARDGQVWLWQLGQDGLRGSRKLGHHRGASHKLTLLTDQPHVILSCGEDAVVYSHDVRDTKPNRVTYAMNKENKKIPLYSIHSHPLKSSEFCVSGHDQAVVVYDQRFISKDCAPMKIFQAKTKLVPERHITASVYNYCGREILASYNDDDIYLFDSESPGNDEIHSYQGHRNGATIKGVNFFGPRSEYVITGSDCGNIFFWDKHSEGIVQFLLADKGVVNCLEPHPSMPVLASSGLDSDVKIWLPSREEPNNMNGLTKTVTGNLRVRSMNGHDHGDNRMIWMLWRVMQRNPHSATAFRRRSDSHNSEEPGGIDEESQNGGSEESSNTPGSSDTDENDEQDGNVECLPS